MARGFGNIQALSGQKDGSTLTSRRLSQRGRVAYGKLWPNGEFSVGASYEALEVCEDLPDNYARLGSRLHQQAVCEQLAQEGVSGLGLSTLPNSPELSKRPPTYGRKGITGLGRKSVRSAAWMIERQAPERTVSFLTLTLPPMSLEGQKTVALEWGAIVGRLVRWLGRKLEIAQVPQSIVSVTELQPARLDSDPLGSLHLHLVFQGKNSRFQGWVVSCAEVRRFWCDELGRRTGELIQSTACENLQMVRKSAEGYLGKYLSKGSAGAESIGETHGWEYVPRQWWNWNASARRMVRSQTRTGTTVGILLESVVEAWLNSGEASKWAYMRPVLMTFGDVTVVVGWTGRLAHEVAQDLRCMLTSV